MDKKELEYNLRLAFNQPKGVFLSALNLELAIAAKNLREQLIEEYDRRNDTPLDGYLDEDGKLVT